MGSEISSFSCVQRFNSRFATKPGCQTDVLRSIAMKLSTVVVAVLVGVAGLILLYLVAQKWKPLGRSLAFVCAVAGRLLVTLADTTENAARYCEKVCHAALKSINDTGVWTMHDLLRRLIDFGLGLLILMGETVQVI